MDDSAEGVVSFFYSCRHDGLGPVETLSSFLRRGIDASGLLSVVTCMLRALDDLDRLSTYDPGSLSMRNFFLDNEVVLLGRFDNLELLRSRSAEHLRRRSVALARCWADTVDDMLISLSDSASPEPCRDVGLYVATDSGGGVHIRPGQRFEMKVGTTINEHEDCQWICTLEGESVESVAPRNTARANGLMEESGELRLSFRAFRPGRTVLSLSARSAGHDGVVVANLKIPVIVSSFAVPPEVKVLLSLCRTKGGISPASLFLRL